MPKRKRAENASVYSPFVPINPDNWSEASKRSMIYDFQKAGGYYKDHYEGIPYICKGCERPAIYSAKAQREAFEVRKVYIWQRRVLCEECFLARIQLEAEVKELQRRWKEERRVLEKDRVALMHWAELLEELPRYGASKDYGQLRMLEKLLAIAA